MQSGFDRRRINGPEESFKPVSQVHESSWKPGNPRSGRQPEAIRPIFLKAGLTNQANGSAYIEAERTKIACSVYGPRQAKNTSYSEKGRLNVEVKFSPFSCQRRRTPLRDAEDRSVAVAIQQALAASVRLEILPKSTVDVYVVVLESDGLEGCIALGSVAASVALANAGIEVFGLVASCAAAIVDGQVWLDPTENEIRVATGSLVQSYMPALGALTSVWQSGQITAEQLLACSSACQERCVDIHSVVAHALLESNTTT